MSDHTALVAALADRDFLPPAAFSDGVLAIDSHVALATAKRGWVRVLIPGPDSSPTASVVIAALVGRDCKWRARFDHDAPLVVILAAVDAARAPA